MNQEFIAGIGNIYGDEILWKAECTGEKSKLFKRGCVKKYLRL